MRRSQLVFAAPALITALAAGTPAVASAQPGGGTLAPGPTGGTQYGEPLPQRPQPLAVRSFRVAPATIRAGARSASVIFRVEGGAAKVRVRFSLMRAGDRVVLGSVILRGRPGRRYTRPVALPAAELTAGSYEATLSVADARPPGRGLRARRAVTRVPVAVAGPEPRPAPRPRPSPTPSGLSRRRPS